MGKGPRYRVAFRRRRAHVTDYKMRKAMILSEKPRLVVRISSKYIYVQLAEALVEGDKIGSAVCSKELERFGWKAAYDNTSAAYLTGLLLGKKAIATGFEEAILDIGLRRPSTGARVFAVLKGAVDAGLKVPHDVRVLPSEERVMGSHVSLYAKRVFEEEQPFSETVFSRVRSKDFRPEQITEHFNQVKEMIINFKGD